MKSSILFVTMVSFASAATATCVCSTGIAMYKYPGGAALIYAIRYETGDCDLNQPGQCQSPTNVYDYRTKGNWENAEHCPYCRPYGRGNTTPTAKPDQSVGNEHAHADAQSTTEPPEQPEGVSVDENFDPIAANVLPEGSEAGQLGFFTLRIKGKMASDIDSNASIKLDKDIETKVFRVRYPNLNEEQIIAFEIKRHVPSAKEISSECISRVQYELPVGDRILTLKVSHKDVPEFKGKTVYLFRANRD